MSCNFLDLHVRPNLVSQQKNLDLFPKRAIDGRKKLNNRTVEDFNLTVSVLELVEIYFLGGWTKNDVKLGFYENAHL